MSNDANIATHLQTINLIPMAAVTADGNGTGVDISQYVGQLAVLLTCKNVAGTSPTLDIKLQESSDDSAYTDISGATFTQVTAANTAAATIEKIVVDASAAKKYIRAVKDIGGTDSPEFKASCVALGVKQVR